MGTGSRANASPVQSDPLQVHFTLYPILEKIKGVSINYGRGTNKSVGGITKFQYPFMGGGSPKSRNPLGGGDHKIKFQGIWNLAFIEV